LCIAEVRLADGGLCAAPEPISNFQYNSDESEIFDREPQPEFEFYFCNDFNGSSTSSLLNKAVFDVTGYTDLPGDEQTSTGLDQYDSLSIVTTNLYHNFSSVAEIPAGVWGELPAFSSFDYDGLQQLQDFDTSCIADNNYPRSDPSLGDLALFNSAAGLQLDNISPISAFVQRPELSHSLGLAPVSVDSPAIAATLAPIVDALQPRHHTPSDSALSSAGTTIGCTWQFCTKSFSSMAEYK
jgi:hypothetical protein